VFKEWYQNTCNISVWSKFSINHASCTHQIYLPVLTHHLFYSRSHIIYSSDVFRCSPTPSSGSPENGDMLVNKIWYAGVNLWSQKQKGPIIILAFVTHHAPTTSCNGTSWMNMGKVLLCDFTYPQQWKQVSSLNRTNVTSTSPSRTPRRYQLTNLPLASWCVSWISWSALFSSDCKCSSFVAIRADNADMSIFWACRNDDFLGDISILATISSS
jgi:hypothetical protein